MRTAFAKGRARRDNPVADGIEVTQFADGLASRIGHRAQMTSKASFIVMTFFF